MVDDRLEVKIMASPFRFERSVDAELAGRITEAINRMGGAGENAEACYQQALDALARRAKEVTSAVAEELDRLEESNYLDRWALVQLLAEMKHESALEALDRLLASKIPTNVRRSAQLHHRRRGSHDPHQRGGAVTRIAADGSERAVSCCCGTRPTELLGQARAIQGFLAHGGEGAREVLLKHLPSATTSSWASSVWTCARCRRRKAACTS
jgi:hypothetical protein